MSLKLSKEETSTTKEKRFCVFVFSLFSFLCLYRRCVIREKANISAIFYHRTTPLSQQADVGRAGRLTRAGPEKAARPYTRHLFIYSAHTHLNFH